MMTTAQQVVLSLLAEIIELSPDIRMGQLMANLDLLGDAYVDKGLGTIEDDELIAVLHRHRADLRARLEGSSFPPLTDAGNGFSVSGSPLPAQSGH